MKSINSNLYISGNGDILPVTKAKLTISIDKAVLDAVDMKISEFDGKRSSCINSILKKGLHVKAKKEHKEKVKAKAKK